MTFDSSMKSYGLTEKEMKYFPLKPVSKRHIPLVYRIHPKVKDHHLYWYIGFLLVFCIIATVLNHFV